MITDGKTDRTVHINRLRKRIQPAPTRTLKSAVDTPCEATWNSPMTEHEVVESEEERHYPSVSVEPQTTFTSSLRTSSF